MSFSSLIANSLVLLFVVGIPVVASYRRIDAYEAFIHGAGEALDVVARILPYLVGMAVAIGMLRASGFFDSVEHLLSPLLVKLSFPIEVLPMALVRPFSGSAATGLMAEVIHSHGGDAFVSKVAATMMGSTETTFYVIAVYFGSVGIRKTRYAIHAGIMADLAGVIASVLICRWLFY